MSVMANHWASRGREVTLITLSEATDFYALHPAVKRVRLGLTARSAGPIESLRSNLRRLIGLRREILASAPDVVISFIHRMNVLTLLATLGTDVPVIVSERIDATKFDIGRLRAGLRRLLYPRAVAVVVQSEGMRHWAQRFLRKEALYTVPNPVAPPRGPGQPDDASCQGHTMIAMGRLIPQKGFDLLLRAFARCAASPPDWSLVILGEGAERGRLEALAGELGVADRVAMPGQVREPTKSLLRADLFVMSSRYEGFPNALLEAMACGLPVVSFDCPSGPGEIIRDGVDGVLVENESVDALAGAMERLMSDEAARERLASRAVEVTERFGLEKVMGIWEDILDQAVKRRGI